MLLPLVPDVAHGRFHGYEESTSEEVEGQVEFITASSTMPVRGEERVSDGDDGRESLTAHRARR